MLRREVQGDAQQLVGIRGVVGPGRVVDGVLLGVAHLDEGGRLQLLDLQRDPDLLEPARPDLGGVEPGLVPGREVYRHGEPLGHGALRQKRLRLGQVERDGVGVPVIVERAARQQGPRHGCQPEVDVLRDRGPVDRVGHRAPDVRLVQGLDGLVERVPQCGGPVHLLDLLAGARDLLDLVGRHEVDDVHLAGL